MLPPGAPIGPYTVESELGVGSTSVVYRVRRPATGVVRALKVLSFAHPEIYRRMAKEGRVQAGLHHRNIVRVIDTVDVEGCLGLVLEYVDGPSLEAWLRDDVDASFEVRDDLACQIVAGVAHAHAAGLIHRDLKPANVLLESYTGGVVARITDFGLAKVLGEGPQPTDTRTGHALGTPRYMAPEQIRSAKHVDARADVFSLGCVLYELYCERHAFPQDTMLDVFNAVCDGVFPDPAEVAPELPARVVSALRASLCPEVDGRPEDAGAMLIRLEDHRGKKVSVGYANAETRVFVRGDDAPRPPSTPPPPEARPAIVESPAPPPASSPAPPPEAPPEPRKRRRSRLRSWLAGVAAVSVGGVAGVMLGVLGLLILAALLWGAS